MHTYLSIVVIFCDLNRRRLPLRWQETHKRTFTLLQIYLVLWWHIFTIGVSLMVITLYATCFPLSRCGAHSHSHPIGLFTFFHRRSMNTVMLYFFLHHSLRHTPDDGTLRLRRSSIPASSTALHGFGRRDLSVSAAFRLSGRPHPGCCDVLPCSSWVSPRIDTEEAPAAATEDDSISASHQTTTLRWPLICFLPSFLRSGGPSPRKPRRYGFIFRLVLYFSGCISFFSPSRGAWLHNISGNHLSVRPSVMMTVAVAAAACCYR